MADREKIRERIVKLLALANDKAAAPGEAANARALAEHLAKDYGFAIVSKKQEAVRAPSQQAKSYTDPVSWREFIDRKNREALAERERKRKMFQDFFFNGQLDPANVFTSATSASGFDGVEMYFDAGDDA